MFRHVLEFIWFIDCLFQPCARPIDSSFRSGLINHQPDEDSDEAAHEHLVAAPIKPLPPRSSGQENGVTPVVAAQPVVEAPSQEPAVAEVQKQQQASAAAEGSKERKNKKK